MLPEVALKECGHCGEFLPFEEFCRNPQTPDGLQYWCRDCAAEYHRYRKVDIKTEIQSWSEADIERIKAQMLTKPTISKGSYIRRAAVRGIRNL